MPDGHPWQKNIPVLIIHRSSRIASPFRSRNWTKGFLKNSLGENKAVAPVKASALHLDAPQEEKKVKGVVIHANSIIMYL